METTVSLVQMLDARERRVQHQQELLARYHKPLICFTMNICGPIKDSPLIRRGFARGRQLLRQQFLRAKLTPLYQDAVREVTGCEAFYVLDADPLTIKKSPPTLRMPPRWGGCSTWTSSARTASKWTEKSWTSKAAAVSSAAGLLRCAAAAASIPWPNCRKRRRRS